MPIKVLLTILSFCFFFAQAQEVDSLQNSFKLKIQSAENDSIRVSNMIDYGEYLINHHFIQSESIVKEGLKIVKEEGLHEKLKALLLVELGIINRRKGRYNESIENYLHALNIFEKLSDQENTADVYHNLSLIHI